MRYAQGGGLTDFYERIGIPKTDESDEVGWNSDRLLELQYSTALSDDGRPSIATGFMVKPVRHYNRLY